MPSHTRTLTTPFVAEYVISMPNMYARGILWGKMVLELGDTCTARNERLGLSAEMQFKTKGYFTGAYNQIAGKIRKTTTNTDLGEIPGKWGGVMEYRPTEVRLCAIKSGGGLEIRLLRSSSRGTRECCLM